MGLNERLREEFQRQYAWVPSNGTQSQITWDHENGMEIIACDIGKNSVEMMVVWSLLEMRHDSLQY